MTLAAEFEDKSFEMGCYIPPNRSEIEALGAELFDEFEGLELWKFSDNSILAVNRND
jgi:hypothetical protein